MTAPPNDRSPVIVPPAVGSNPPPAVVTSARIVTHAEFAALRIFNESGVVEVSSQSWNATGEAGADADANRFWSAAKLLTHFVSSAALTVSVPAMV